MAKQNYQIDDAKTFDANLTVLAERLKLIDADLGPVLGGQLAQLAEGKATKDVVWDALLASISKDQP